MKNRLGKFYIDKDLIENNFEEVQKIMSKVVVVRAEMLYQSNSIEYMAISKDFDEVSEGKEIPTYKVKVSQDIVIFH